ncbi:MAG: 3-carboxy-cis,cis-muconate cycloisomerase [Rhodomicrobiaceae bacterium]
MTISLFDHPLFAGLLGDPTISHAFSTEAELAAMVRFESALAEVEAELGIIPAEAARAIVKACAAFSPDLEKLRDDVQRDGLAVPGLVKQLRASVGEPHGAHFHFGATSQDLMDTGLILRLQPVLDRFHQRLQELADALVVLDERFGAHPLMGKTRMRSALPITVAIRLRNWSEPLHVHEAQLNALRPALSTLQFAGAVGTLDKLGDRGPAVRNALAARLGLNAPAGSWHVQRTRFGDFGNWLSAVTATLGKMGADLALMGLDEVGAAELTGGGGSSAMPHKQNPVAAETLTALARYNAAQLGGLHQALVHEHERSGAMWTLEWLILPGMVAATGAALLTANRLALSIEHLGGCEIGGRRIRCFRGCGQSSEIR